MIVRGWRRHPRYTRYAISVYGSVLDGETNRLVASSPFHGYERVALWIDGRKRRVRVSHLVLETFVGPRPSPRHVAAHAPDRDRSNNRVDNLRWALPTENEADKRSHGTMRGGGAKTWTPHEKVQAIRALAAAKVSLTAIAKQHGLHRSSVARIVKGLRRAG